ncbi:MAG: hypothetical protein JNM25_18220 [Planctomycetes bacterium]|nr:hypothetical protein [Planctomycetota bacterium]
MFPSSSCWILTSMVLVGAGCSSDVVAAATQQQPKPVATGEPAPAVPAPHAEDSRRELGPVVDAPIDPYRRDLLHLAYQAAAALPVDPHAKSRASAQELVVLACLDLEQPTLALKFAEEIGNWRRGTALADCAHYCALHGDLDGAARHLAAAEKIAGEIRLDADQQAWRYDSIVMKLARTHAWLGDRQKAEQLAAVVDQTSGQAFDGGWAASVASRADLVTADTLDAELSQLDGIIASATSGEAYNAVSVCTRLFDRFYADAEQREKIARRVRTRDSKLPPDLFTSGLMELARIAIKHDDKAAAKDLLAEARHFLSVSELTKEFRLGFTPLMAIVRFQAGDVGAAQGELEAGLEVYQNERETYRGTKRAKILRPFAEAYQVMGDTQRAGDLYELVVEEGMENPNSRPRAHDISETCLSMARHRFAPDQKLLARIREIVGGLGDPW